MTDLPRLGHNGGPPLDPAVTWRRHAWGVARKQLWKPAPIEVVRRQIRRAQALGLDYRQYSLITLASGRDLGAFLVTGRALGSPVPAAPRVARLATLERCEVLLMDEAAERLALRLRAAGLTLAAVAAPPPPGASFTAARAAVRAALDGRRLPSDAVLLIGEGPEQKAWAEAARLAGFIPAASYFGERA
jgi:hypothetical protein